jgi:hypothetical protein
MNIPIYVITLSSLAAFSPAVFEDKKNVAKSFYTSLG